MSAVVETRGVTKRYRDVVAVDDVSIRLEEGRVYGLLGRNGAGKTTLMTMLTAQEFATAGSIQVFGLDPVEHAAALARIAFIREGQKYPEGFKVKHVLAVAPSFYPGWDQAYADRLAAAFGLPADRPMRKLSRGQLSAVGVVIGLASRAPLTLFDEPYLGLDAAARQRFYDELLADIAERPRTVLLSTHLIDEVSDLLEHVIVMDQGRILVDRDADELRGTAMTVAGRREAVDAFVAGREVLHRDGIGGLATATVADVTDADRQAATAAGLELGTVSLQQLFVSITGTPEKGAHS